MKNWSCQHRHTAACFNPTHWLFFLGGWGNFGLLNLTNRCMMPVHFLGLVLTPHVNQRSEQSTFYAFITAWFALHSTCFIKLRQQLIQRRRSDEFLFWNSMTRLPVVSCSRSGHHDRQWRHYAIARIWMFCGSTSDTQHSAIRVRICLHVAGRVAHHATSTLRQRHARRISREPAPPTSQCSTLPSDWFTEKVGANTSHLFCELHWLRSRERVVDFKLAVLIFRCLHGLAPRYLADDIRRVADTNRRRLRLSSSALLTVRPTLLVTMGDRAFSVAGSGLWNTLPHDVTSAPTLPVFSNRLKSHLFKISFPAN